ncbi:SprT family zinc-dependent metalloprotease [Draconibacterium sp. IB214405]|uniref:M48 family metallopeptidase n=1 Tax=Draconibacterium sp. IB214405 TaxID=3097352 RepID=UPI002A125C03|nr:SprT family zinc-dependent metalloprotease [Draconibacterium sp. IB214405]MDX8341348.1 SprT family zinc-dependent metalloprotease [Draconibacterium sp. IB214405]
MASQVVQLKHLGKVTFSQNQRSKNIKLSVKPDKTVLVSFPFFVSAKEAMAFVVKNEGWILTQQEKMQARNTHIKHGTEIETKLHTIQIVQGEKNHIKRSDTNITISVTDFNSDESMAFIDDKVTAVYRAEAKRLLPVRLSQLANQFGFKYNKVSIRNNRRNWGSCSSKNNISLNLQMMKLPVKLIDYILLHELVHTEIKNHGPKFWERLNQITNGKARELSREVKKYSTYTL